MPAAIRRLSGTGPDYLELFFWHLGTKRLVRDGLAEADRVRRTSPREGGASERASMISSQMPAARQRTTRRSLIRGTPRGLSTGTV